jgi:CRISPR-associated endonuclease Csn1
LFHQLQRVGLLPAGESRTPKQRCQIINKLDKELLANFLSQNQNNPAECHRIANVLPYILRAKALEVELPPFELGRIFYQMAQRRGFKSNRKERAKDIDESGESKDEEKGKIAPAIRLLNGQMRNQTLGQYLSTLNPEEQSIMFAKLHRKHILITLPARCTLMSLMLSGRRN